ncbi:MAG: DUF362 domain-containing protein [Spirochaetes bacterium]|nr:DUF362 domain-containing protein [Spirochaetota bacterium]
MRGRSLKKSKVVILKTKPETVLADYEKLLKMANIKDALPKGAPVILKDNISWHLPMPGANSTPWQLEGTIMTLRNLGYKDIVAVENKTVVTKPKHGEKLNKFDIVFNKYNIPVKYNFNPEDMKWIVYRPKAKLRVLPKIYPEGIRIPDYFIGKNIIHFPTMKCHIYTTTTGSMKNAFGGLLSTRRHYTHSWIHETLVDLLKIQKEIHPGIFAAMDGTTAGNGPGPRTLIPVKTDYILASADQVAIDAVAARLMGFDPMKLDYIRLAVEEGLGNGDPRNIEIAGEDVSKVNLNFSVGDNLASTVGDLLWFGPLKALQKLMFHTPLVYIFIMASAVYHDRVWWNLKGRKILAAWKAESPWGQLWDRY